MRTFIHNGYTLRETALLSYRAALVIVYVFLSAQALIEKVAQADDDAAAELLPELEQVLVRAEEATSTLATLIRLMNYAESKHTNLKEQ